MVLVMESGRAWGDVLKCCRGSKANDISCLIAGKTRSAYGPSTGEDECADHTPSTAGSKTCSLTVTEPPEQGTAADERLGTSDYRPRPNLRSTGSCVLYDLKKRRRDSRLQTTSIVPRNRCWRAYSVFPRPTSAPCVALFLQGCRYIFLHPAAAT